MATIAYSSFACVAVFGSFPAAAASVAACALSGLCVPRSVLNCACASAHLFCFIRRCPRNAMASVFWSSSARACCAKAVASGKFLRSHRMLARRSKHSLIVGDAMSKSRYRCSASATKPRSSTRRARLNATGSAASAVFLRSSLVSRSALSTAAAPDSTCTARRACRNQALAFSNRPSCAPFPVIACRTPQLFKSAALGAGESFVAVSYDKSAPA
mmetsp:Transcript_3300/g.12309  ORF Transcript_3300/g.12309 Transcript_3300/m.12309 type:complete len:215 (+) Transcript_3300:1721-2365(+)